MITSAALLLVGLIGRQSPAMSLTHLTETTKHVLPAFNYAKFKASRVAMTTTTKKRPGKGVVAVLTSSTPPGPAGPSDSDITADLKRYRIKPTIYNHLVFSRSRNGVGRYGGFYAKVSFDVPKGVFEISGGPAWSKPGQSLIFAPHLNTNNEAWEPDLTVHYDYAATQRDASVSGRAFLMVYSMFSDMDTSASFERPNGSSDAGSSVKLKPRQMVRVSQLVTGLSAFAHADAYGQSWNLSWTAEFWNAGSNNLYVSEIDVYEVGAPG